MISGNDYRDALFFDKQTLKGLDNANGFCESTYGVYSMDDVAGFASLR